MVFGDYHTHSIYSDGKITMEESVNQAINIGLKQLAITDHAFNHCHGINKKDFFKIKEEMDKLKEKYKDKIELFFGLEANFISIDGKYDISDEIYDNLDIVVLGYHKSFKPKTLKNIFGFYLPNVFNKFRLSKKQVEKNTQAYIKAISTNKIDILSHLNYAGCFVDAVKVAECAKKYNTYIELSSKHMELTPKEICAMVKTGVKFVLSSDGHTLNRIGDNHVGVGLMEKYNIPEDQIANWNKVPVFKKINNKKTTQGK